MDIHPAYILPAVATIHPDNPGQGGGFSNPAMSDEGSEDSRSISLVDVTIERLGKTSRKAGKVENKRPPRSESLCHADGIHYSHELNRWHSFDDEITFTQSSSSANGADSGLHSLVVRISYAFLLQFIFNKYYYLLSIYSIRKNEWREV